MHHLNQDILEKVQAAIHAAPHTMTLRLAQQYDVPETAIIAALPEEMRMLVPVADFAVLWKELTTWQKVTFIVMNNGIISETVGQMPEGAESKGMFNYHAEGNPIGGHLRITELGSIWLVAKPMKSTETLSVRFFDTNGDRICAVYAGRGKDRQLLPSVKEKFADLWAKHAAMGERN